MGKRCAVCGQDNTSEARFCVRCGAPLAGGPAPTDMADGWPAPAAPMGGAPSPAMSPAAPAAPTAPVAPAPAAAPATAATTQAAPQKPRATRLRIVLAIALIALVAVGGTVGFFAYSNYQREQERAAELAKTHAVTLAIKADGLDAKTGTKVPFRIVGTAERGDKVDETAYAAADGSGIELMPGTYTLTVPASPIAGDGTLYDVEGVKATVTVPAGDARPADGADATIELPVTDPLKVTDEQIDKAYKYAEKGGAADKATADQLKDAATKRRDDAVAAKKAADEKAAAEKKAAEEKAAAEKKAAEEKAARHFETASYSFDIPAYWLGRVNVQIDGDTATIYSKKYPDDKVCWIAVEDEQYAVGDIGTSQIGSLIPLGNGRVIQVWAHRWGYSAAYAAYQANRGYPLSDAPSDEEADELTDLQTGGSAIYSSNPGGYAPDNGSLINSVDTYLEANLNPTITPR